EREAEMVLVDLALLEEPRLSRSLPVAVTRIALLPSLAADLREQVRRAARLEPELPVLDGRLEVEARLAGRESPRELGIRSSRLEAIALAAESDLARVAAADVLDDDLHVLAPESAGEGIRARERVLLGQGVRFRERVVVGGGRTGKHRDGERERDGAERSGEKALEGASHGRSSMRSGATDENLLQRSVESRDEERTSVEGEAR